MADSFSLGDVDTFTTGALGRPGQRVFLVQARVPGRLVTLKAEKQQVDALGRYLANLLSDLATPNDVPLPDTLELNDPIEPAWVVGSIAVAYQEAADRVVVVLEELVPDDDSEVEPAELRVELTRGQALAFAVRAETVVAAGRPSCRFCGFPIDPDGHPCPRMN